MSFAGPTGLVLQTVKEDACHEFEQQNLPLTRNFAGALCGKPVHITFWDETFSQYAQCGK